MTKYEKISLGISIFAIVVSIASPIVTYQLFHPIKQELAYAGKLNVAERFLFHGGRKNGYEIKMVNIGAKPIDDIIIGMMAIEGSIHLPQKKASIIIETVTPFSYHVEEQRAYLVISKTLANDQSLIIRILDLNFDEGAESHNFRVDISSSMGDAVKISRFRGAGASANF
ncbi:MAG: hypothetical protein D3909_06175 [Candidatus Electrothrix sp. ATG1]|nr:hypothetical protein [Candidatus Electrothrix sp. ATG1]